jgi:hypothetical protein
VAHRWRAARQEHTTTMFVRFRTTPCRLQVSILEARRSARKVTNEHIASLGSVAVPCHGKQVVEWVRPPGPRAAS